MDDHEIDSYKEIVFSVNLAAFQELRKATDQFDKASSLIYLVLENTFQFAIINRIAEI
jgi:hypothetical protein